MADDKDKGHERSMTVTSALTEGVTLVNRAPVILACVFLVTFLTALPFSMTLRTELASHLGNSMVAEQVARGVNVQWWSEFTAQTGPLGQTFQTSIIGFAAVLDNLSHLADGEARPSPILWLGAIYLLLWLFLTGGVLDRYARARPTHAYEFFAACGIYFVRFLRLAPIVAIVYYGLFAVVHPLVLETTYEELTRDVTAERTAFLIRLALYLLFGVILAVVNVIFDYTKVRAVVEDRRSMIGAIAAGTRFVSRHAGAVARLYLLNTALFVAVIVIYALVSPSAQSAGAGVWLGVVISQLYLAARLWVKLVFLASETALFQGRLAHAGYVASAPSPRSEPPVVERLTSTGERRYEARS
jgi:hypothetical protein